MRESIVLECRKVAQTFLALETVAADIEAACDVCIQAIRRGGAIYFCGNGGSAADAQHFAAELVGRYRKERSALRAVALTVDSSVLTSVGNDYGFEEVFSRQVEGLAEKGDVLVAISTSGNSANVLRAIEAAKKLGAVTIGLTGRAAGKMQDICDVMICAPSEEVPRIQELHAAIGHILCGEIEEACCE